MEKLTLFYVSLKLCCSSLWNTAVSVCLNVCQMSVKISRCHKKKTKKHFLKFNSTIHCSMIRWKVAGTFVSLKPILLLSKRPISLAQKAVFTLSFSLTSTCQKELVKSSFVKKLDPTDLSIVFSMDDCMHPFCSSRI